MSEQQVFNTLEQLKSSNFTHIKITGGEPFLREDMVDILEKIDSLGLECDISTNASKITPEIANRISKLNLDYVHVSLDGHTQTIHESVRGKKSFWPTLLGLNFLLNAGIKVRIGCVLHSNNENEILNMIKWCEELGVNEVIFSIMESVGRMRDSSKFIVTKTAQELLNIIEDIQKNHKNSTLKISHNLNPMIKPIEFKSQSVSACPGGDRFLFINSVGIVSPCPWVAEKMPEFIGASLHNHNLHDILNQEPFTTFKKITKQISLHYGALCPMEDLNKTKAIKTQNER